MKLRDRIPLKNESPESVPRSLVFNFLNSLPLTGNTLSWITQFREALMLLFTGVNHISISVNVGCDITNPSEYNSSIGITQHITGDPSRPNEMVVSSLADPEPPSKHLLADFHTKGYPLEKYHDPIAFDYYLQGKAYLGTIFLWAEKSNPPISETAIREFESLQSFILFALSDLVARHNDAKPFDRAFTDALYQMARQAGLTEQERKIVLLQVYGHTYEEIGQRLFISVDTVRKHIQSIYRKTGTRSNTELFAKYFTPRIGF